jgi:hypothetical protein
VSILSTHSVSPKQTISRAVARGVPKPALTPLSFTQRHMDDTQTSSRRISRGQPTHLEPIADQEPTYRGRKLRSRTNQLPLVRHRVLSPGDSSAITNESRSPRSSFRVNSTLESTPGISSLQGSMPFQANSVSPTHNYSFMRKAGRKELFSKP